MPGFYWLPFRDEDWLKDSYTRANRYQDRMLPFLDGSPAAGGGLPAGGWDQIAPDNSIWLPVHGHKYTTEKVSWSVSGNLISWSANQFADELKLKLDRNFAQRHHYHLLACFGANNITYFAQSFGSRLADAMKRRGFRGDVTAYVGATGMTHIQGHQIGTSRLSAAPKFLAHAMRGGKGAPSHVTLATRDAAKTWPLG